MWLESKKESFTYRWRGGQVYLEPGKPVQLPDYRAMRLVSRHPGKVRQIHRLATEVKPLLRTAPTPPPTPRQEVQEELPFTSREEIGE